MALVEDAASLLEMWTQDVANLPAEMSHLMEEIEAKDKIVAEHRLAISQRDLAIQKHIKTHGMTVLTPKEEHVCKTVDGHFGTAIIVQNEKVALAEKARILLDRHVKRLDVQIRQLEDAGFMQPDPQLPSIINNDTLATGNMLPSNSRLNGGALLPISGNAVDFHPVHPSTTIANSNIARLVTNGNNNVNGSRSPRAASPSVTLSTAALMNRGTRESSLDSNKRRKLNLPSQNSSLRQSSLGPNSPASQNGLNGTKSKDQGTLNNIATSGSQQRSNSVGARGLPKKISKSSNLAPSAKMTHLHPGMAKKSASRRKAARKNGVKASMSDTGDESALSEIDGSDGEGNPAQDGTSGRDSRIAVLAKPNLSSDMAVDEDEDAGDDKKYCVCHSISYGNMVACDNPDCKNEWFHWQCVGITKEPVGKWYCPACKDLFAAKA